MCSIVFHAFTLKLPIQTLLSVVPTRSVFWYTTQFQQNEHTPGKGLPRGVLDSVNFGCFVLSKYECFHCNVIRKLIMIFMSKRQEIEVTSM